MAPLDLLSCSPENIDSALGRLPNDEQLDAIVAFLRKFETVSAKQDKICEQGEAVQTFVVEKNLSGQIATRNDNNLLSLLEQILMPFRLRRNKSEQERIRSLERIRGRPGWKEFPDCLPKPLRQRKNKTLTDFGTSILGHWCKLAELASFESAMQFFEDRDEKQSTEKVFEQCWAVRWAV
jgi:hypothetical protein